MMVHLKKFLKLHGQNNYIISRMVEEDTQHKLPGELVASMSALNAIIIITTQHKMQSR